MAPTFIYYYVNTVGSECEYNWTSKNKTNSFTNGHKGLNMELI